MKISVECNWLNSRLSRISEFLICDEKAGRDPKILRLGIL